MSRHCAWFLAFCYVASASCVTDFNIGSSDPDAQIDPSDGGTDAGVSTPDGAGVDAGSCTPTETNESLCDDGEDTDCDGVVDCLDTDCEQQPCSDGDVGTIGDTCIAGVCLGTPCTPTGTTELDCTDGDDDDCDGLADCADPDCTGEPCDDGDTDTRDDMCTANGCAGTPCNWTTVCSQCGTGNCHDVLTGEDHPGCGCASSISVPSCVNVGSTYNVDCGDGINFCHYRREEITEPCNCHDVCQ